VLMMRISKVLFGGREEGVSGCGFGCGMVFPTGHLDGGVVGRLLPVLSSPPSKRKETTCTHQRQTNVKLKRSNNHLSVREMAWFILPFPPPCVVGVCSEMLTERESSILTKLARPRTYLIRMAMMQTPPTTQPTNTGDYISPG
jgi:hypothetical protein